MPLRLLAREVYGRIVARVGPSVVALVTGEERIVPPNPRWLVCTVEAMPLDILPEFNPFKYNSFPVNGARQSYRLTHAIQQQVREQAASGELAARSQQPFPACLGELPLLLPDQDHPLYAQLLGWLHDQGITPWIRAEISDSALMKVMAEAGDGVMAATEEMMAPLAAHHGLQNIGSCADLHSEVFLIVPSQRNPHPAAEAILKNQASEAEGGNHVEA